MKLKNDKVELRSFDDAAPWARRSSDGDIDMMTRTMSPEQITSSTTSSTGDIDLVQMPGLEIRYLAFNTDAPTVKNKAVRQAMAQLIDRSRLVAKVYGDARPSRSTRWSPPPSPATPTPSSTSTATRATPRPRPC